MQNNFTSLYVILGIMATILILTGLFLGDILGIFNINLNKIHLRIAEIAFIVSGLADVVLLFYAKKKLS